MSLLKNEPLGHPASLEFQSWGYKHASRQQYAVRDLTLTIKAGQRVLLLGASGVGKSTILHGAAGILGVSADAVGTSDGNVGVEDADGGLTRGTVLVDGVPSEHAHGRVGLVLQDPDAQAVFQRVGDNVAFGPENLGLSREVTWKRVHDSLAEVGLEDLQLHRSTNHLSGGQMQRLALAGALAMRPGILLLDEPTANLDPDGYHQVADAVRQVLNQQGSTMVLVEHRTEVWLDIVDRVVVLGANRLSSDNQLLKTEVVADGSPKEVFTDDSVDLAQLGIWVPKRYVRQNRTVIDLSSQGDSHVSKGVPSNEPILMTKDLSVGREEKAIATDINLDFYGGQITALVGDNGAGKSTLALTLAGLLKPVSGKVQASSILMSNGIETVKDEQPIDWNSRQLASRISYVFQNPEHQFARGSVLEEVMLAPLRMGMEKSAAEEKAQSLLERFKLSQYAHVNPYTLSGGEKRRLTVAAALAAAPQVLILDEPTFGQDKVTWTRMVELINSLREDGICIIVVTHDYELVEALQATVVELTQEDSIGSWNQASCVSREKQIPVQPLGERVEEIKPASKSAYIASINPAFRLIGACVLALPLFFSLDWLSALTALSIEVILLMVSGFTPWRIVKSSWPIFLGASGSALAVLLYGKRGGAQLWHWGLMNVTEQSVTLACATVLRILALGVPAIIMMLGIDATDLADSFSQVLHLPDRFVYGGLAGLRLFAVIKDDWSALSASRRSRGLGDDNKFKAFLPQAFALLVLSIRRSTTLAEAMEARGFGGTTPRSHARISSVGIRDYGFLALCVAVPLFALAVAWWGGTFAFFGN